LGVSGFDRQPKVMRRIGNAKVVRIGITRSKMQIKINANDDVYSEDFALAA